MEVIIPAALDGCEDELSQTNSVTAQHAVNADIEPWKVGGFLKLDDAHLGGAFI